MSRVSEILLRVRDSLADQNKKRFSDERLIRLLNEAQEQVAIATKSIQKTILAPVLASTNLIALPDGCLSVLRAEYTNLLTLASHEEMDKKYGAWQTVFGEPTHLIYDLRKPTEARLWPTIEQTELTVEMPTYGVLTSLGPTTIAEVYGAAANTLGFTLTGEVNYGLVTELMIPVHYVTITYASAPDILDTSADPETLSLTVPAIFDNALKHYIVGFALRDNMDTQNRAAAQEALQQASASLAVATRLVAQDFARPNLSTTYRSAFDV